MDAAQGAASVAHNAGMLAQAGPRLTQVAQRLADMDAMGVDVQVLSPAPNQYYYWAEDDLAEQIVCLQNEHIAALCAAYPTRFAGLGTLALQNMTLALAQLDHAVLALGLRGIEISTTVNGVSIADERFAPLWQRAEALGCAVLLHPLGSEQGTRLATHYLWNVIGQPFETTVALSQLALSGVLERHAGLKLCACHGGGFLPAYWGRTDHAWRVRPEARLTPQPPSHYLRRVYFDSVVYDPLQLRHLIDRVGASQVVIGTDYPFDMGDYDVHGLIAAVPGLTDDERDAIHAGNAERLLTLADGRPFAPGLAPGIA
ncbi:MAG TPA: amidohydrolase family protein, partial [Burkholderiaceae bacterium]|nr:amidohydrolase family protein [Burkholderiaceae bacterium]